MSDEEIAKVHKQISDQIEKEGFHDPPTWGDLAKAIVFLATEKQNDEAGFFMHKCKNSNTKPKSWKDRISSKLGL